MLKNSARTHAHTQLVAFQLYDIDRDGFITREEMLKIVEALYRMVRSWRRWPTFK